MIDKSKYKIAACDKNNTVIRCGIDGNVVFGGNDIQIIAGPCAIESREQIITIAKAVKNAGATMLRGGAFKPRTSPYDFQGLGEEGLIYLAEARRLTGLSTVSEIMDASQLDLFEDVDILQIGARNMQNYTLLKTVGKSKKPILLKRGFGNTIDELLCSAEYILSNGNPNVILCERGIRTFDNETRFTLDLGIIRILKEKTHLPIIVDPSHATGNSKLVHPISNAAAVVGVNGIMIEVGNIYKEPVCDKKQAITPKDLSNIVSDVKFINQVGFNY